MRDPLGRLLELGLVAVVLLAPLPGGAVRPAGRLALEITALTLVAVWLVRAIGRPTAIPPSLARAGLVGLLALGLVQALPLGDGAVSRISPRSVEIREASRPSADAFEAERRLLGADPRALDSSAAISVDPGRTASALRTGAALAALLLVATTVAAERGVGLLALAFALTAMIQGLVGILAAASGSSAELLASDGSIISLATGTFVNKNHFAGLLEAALPCGVALAVSIWRRKGRQEGPRSPLLALFGSRGSQTLLVGLLVLIGTAGLLLSFSRAGTALGVAAIVLTFVATGQKRIKIRLAVAILLIAAAAVPLFQMGADRVAERYAKSTEEFRMPGARAMVWQDTLTMAAAFPVAGTGYGTFAAAYPGFRSPDVRLFYDHAHNDLLQALSEGGAVGFALLLLVLAPVLGRIARALTGEFGPVPVGLAAGLLAFLLHGLIDFNFHIPSNAAIAAILAGALFGVSWTGRS